MINDTTLSYKDGDKTRIDSWSEEKGLWIGDATYGNYLLRYATFDYS